MFGEIGKIAVVHVLGHDFPGRLAMLNYGNGSESGGCNVLDQVQANRWDVCDAKSLGPRLAHVTSSTEIRERTNCVCAEDACRCLCLLLQAAELSRVWQKRNCAYKISANNGVDQGCPLSTCGFSAAIYSRPLWQTSASYMIQVPSSLPTWTTGTCGSNRSAYCRQSLYYHSSHQISQPCSRVHQDTSVESLLVGPDST